MPNEEKQWYEMLKHNFVKHDGSTDKVITTVRGLRYAERMADVLTERLSPEEKEAGFAVYLAKGQKASGCEESPQTTRQEAKAAAMTNTEIIPLDIPRGLATITAQPPAVFQS